MSKALSAWYHHYSPGIVITGMNCCAWMLFFHWMRGLSWSDSFLLALGTLLVHLTGWNRN